MQTTLVKFHTSDNLRLDGLLFEPEAKTDKIVIEVHGTSSSFYTNQFVPVFAEHITGAGRAFLSFNNRGAELEKRFYREINGKVVEKVVLGSKHEVFEDCLLDIRAAVDYAESLGYTDIVLSGHSYGCNKVVYYALANNFEGGIILLAPCDSGAETWKPLKKEARDLANLDLFRYEREPNPLLAPLHNNVLVQIGTDDAYITEPDKVACMEALARAFRNSVVSYNIIDGANHNYDGHYEEVAENIVAWLLTPHIHSVS
jgi:dienelactone hydrolase